MGEGPNARGGSRLHIMDQVKASLDAVAARSMSISTRSTASIPRHRSIETLEALDTLVRHGHVRYIGLSNWAAWQVAKAVGLAEARRLAPVVSLQAYYTLAGRDLEREIVPMLMSEGVGLMVWSPLAGGFLSGKYDREGKTAEGRRVGFDFPPIDKDRAFDAVDVMRGIAEAKGCTVPQVAIAWLLHRPVVTSVIVGAKRVDQLTDNIGAAEVSLSADDIAALDAATELPAEYPGWMLELQTQFRAELMREQLR
jgi:aryl-alcohol dehydrogenase-like predicted oxidoreductase